MKTRAKTFSKLIILIAAYLFFSGDSLFAQYGWETVYTDTNGAGFGSGGIFFTSANTGYAVGSRVINNYRYPRVIKTTDAGSNWTDLTTPLGDSNYFYFRYVFFTDVNTGFITAAQNINPITVNGKILKTTNGGDTWSVYTPSVNKHMTCIWFINSLTGFATGHNVILKTTNAGSSWELSLDASGNGYLFGIYFTTANTGYIVGNYGWSYITTNCGGNWAAQKADQFYSESLWSVWFADANTGIIVGGDQNNIGNKIFRTTNAGISWDSVQHQPSNGTLYSVRFVNPATGFITGDYAQVFKTTNGGLSWYRQYLQVPDSNIYFAAGTYFTSVNTGYLAGTSFGSKLIANVFKTTTGGDPLGIKPISDKIPGRYSLYQNYPNPFNPSTNIKFDLPKSSYSKLSIFDVLGREIAVLVNEQLRPGKYEVDWNASNFSSGVYFCKLVSSTFVETKKMILLK